MTRGLRISSSCPESTAVSIRRSHSSHASRQTMMPTRTPRPKSVVQSIDAWRTCSVALATCTFPSQNPRAYAFSSLVASMSTPALVTIGSPSSSARTLSVVALPCPAAALSRFLRILITAV